MDDPPTPTLRDVAAQARVSTATVSNCFNHPERVSSATAERVADAVAKLGYEPNGAAVGLSRHRWNRT